MARGALRTGRCGPCAAVAGRGQRWPWYSFFSERPAKARTPTQTSTRRVV
ncbi:hypothetical protein STTU_2984 [Streptomyces sp. Tu6071]|nr:hypothetical protein STTU_2984 [Streptomyces sp. Tu6071]